jgi:hypothetical protein
LATNAGVRNPVALPNYVRLLSDFCCCQISA